MYEFLDLSFGLASDFPLSLVLRLFKVSMNEPL